ncbi:MAG: NADP oxidoreductase [Bacteroidia bacterium]|nr:MAG: NADP oxidoreductase [Bacteroidia bacterium]
MPRVQRPHNISLIGAGRVGSTLAVLLSRKGYRFLSVISRSPSSARSLARKLRVRIASSRIEDIPAESDLVMVAVPDESIETVVRDLAREVPLNWPRVTVFHVSGAVTRDALADAAVLGARTFSLHPIQLFPRKNTLKDQIAIMKGIWYGFEGERRAERTAKRLVRDLGGKIVVVPKQAKILYHAACVFASNYPVAVLAVAQSLARQAGLSGLAPLSPLINAAVGLASAGDPREALTGPIARGSVETVRRQRQALEALDPRVARAYAAIGSLALDLATEKGGMEKERIRILRNLLTSKP